MYKFNYSIVAIAKKETPYIREWLHYHRLVGFQHFFLYDNGDPDDEPLAATLEREKDDCTITLLPGQVMQFDAYFHFIRKFNHLTKWAAFIDIDEFIVPVQHDTIGDFLKKFGVLECIGINWKTFGPSGHTTKPEGLVIENYCDCIVEPLIKSLILTSRLWPQKPKNPHNIFHECRSLDGVKIKSELGNSFCLKNFTNTIRVNHYFTKSIEEFKQKCNRGRSDMHTKRTMEHYLPLYETDMHRDTVIIDKYLKPLKESLGGS